MGWPVISYHAIWLLMRTYKCHESNNCSAHSIRWWIYIFLSKHSIKNKNSYSIDKCMLISFLQHVIKFTLEHSAQEISFLDTKIRIQNHLISTTLYTKPTDKNSILHATSAHPTSLKKKMPFSQFGRLKHICTSPDFEREVQNMYINFQQRVYPTSWLEAALEKVRHMDVSQPSTHNLTQKTRSSVSLLTLPWAKRLKTSSENSGMFSLLILSV